MGINVENILRVADAIEQHSIPDLGFNMYDYVSEADYFAPDRSGHGCGTNACIAGYAVAIRNNAVPTHWLNVHGDAEDWMGLDEGQAEDLFYASGSGIPLKDIEPSQAVAVLRHLAATGEVDWTISSPEAA